MGNENFFSPERAAVDLARCLHRRLKKDECRMCENICPQKSIAVKIENQESPVKIDASCTGCGICAAHCPGGALRVEGSGVRTLAVNGEAAEVYCTRLKADGALSCLGQLNAHRLAAWALQAGEIRLRLDEDFCARCRPGVADAVREFAANADEWLRRLGHGRVRMVAADRRGFGRVGRRELFSLCFSRIRGQVARTLPLTAAETEDDRRLLAGLLAERRLHVPEGDAAPLFWGAAVTERCDLCGVCARACQRGALTLRQEGTTVSLWHDQSRCAGCRLCQRLCPAGALAVEGTASRFAAVAALGEQCLRLRPQRFCSGCGQPLRAEENTFCRRCRIRRQPKLQSIY